VSSKSVLIVIAAALALAAAVAISVSTDANVSSSDGDSAEIIAVGGLCLGPMCSDADMDAEVTDFPSAPPAPAFQFSQTPPTGPESGPDGGKHFRSQPGHFSMSDGGMDGMPPGMGCESPMDGPRMHPKGEMTPPGHGPTQQSCGNAVVLVIEDESISTKDIVEEYEKAYYEAKENNTSVIVVDSNDYTGEQAEIVEAMNKVLSSSESQGDFLTMVADVLSSEGKQSSANTVREIMDGRFNGDRRHAELRNPDQKSREDDDDDDINSDPVYFDEKEEDDDASNVFDAPVLTEADSAPVSDAADLCVRLDIRYCCDVI